MKCENCNKRLNKDDYSKDQCQKCGRRISRNYYKKEEVGK